MAQVVPACRQDANLLDFLEKLLTFNPSKRISVQRALEVRTYPRAQRYLLVYFIVNFSNFVPFLPQHPFLAANRAPETEIVADFSYDGDFDFEDEDADSLDKERIQSLMWNEIRYMHPYIRSTHP